MGEVADEANEELELGNLECPRREKVGVGGVELSDVQYEGVDVCIVWPVLIAASSSEETDRVLAATN
jgi:hypothetical protein